MEPVDYGIAKLSDVEDVIRLLAAVFSELEPPAVAVGLSVQDMETFLQLIVSGIIPEELTVLARTKKAGQLAGVLLTDDFASPPVLDLNQINSNFQPILSMVEILDEQYRRGKTIAAGECLHLFLLGVDGQFAGSGIGQGLVKACLDNGFRKGYRLAVTEATGRVSQHIFRKHGFVDRFRVAYREFMYREKIVFASIQGHESAILMERSIAATNGR